MNKPKSTVDQKAALHFFQESVKNAKDQSYEIPAIQWVEEIKAIIIGKSITFRYILITALLAKVTDENINPLSLQAGAPVIGAYDARSLCHKVVVPAETEMLDRAFGGSNEPFVTNPGVET